MRKRLIDAVVILTMPAVLFFCALHLTAQTLAQSGSASASGSQAATDPRDLSGVWIITGGQATSWDPSDPTGAKPDQLPMTPWAREKLQAARPPFGAKGTFDNPNDPVETHCDPPGLTRMYSFPWQFTVVQTPSSVYILFEYFHIWRVVTMNRPHPQNLDSTWFGDSVGRYEGDTLVIDTVGLNDKSWLDNVGHPHSDALHTVERFRRLDQDTLRLDLTIDDPKAYTKPWTARKTYKRSTFPLGETMCSLSEIQSFQKDVMDRTTQPTAE
jgi:hypothetical protein